MMIQKLSIEGFRGFGKKQTITFSIPDGETPGRGLNVLVGGNNAGKTTVIEAIRAFNARDKSPTFSEGRRNEATGKSVSLELTDEQGETIQIHSRKYNDSTTEKVPADFKRNYYVLQSRRHVPFEFSEGSYNRDEYIHYYQKLPAQRSGGLEAFQTRLFRMTDHREEVDVLLKQVLGHALQWGIEQRDSGQYYIKYTYNGVSHSSEGVGDGIWSVFTICDALYDAPDGTTVVIDEPELSLHPSLQKRLMALLLEQSATKQIIICTHSAHFVSWEAITRGGGLIRMVKEGTNSMCYQITEDCAKQFGGLLRDLNNPHTLGLDATEALFLEDNIILVEGQEDVLIYRRIAKELGIDLRGEFFGWGAGGAPKMPLMLRLFRDLGYKHVTALFDGDKRDLAKEMEEEYPQYHILVLKKDDVRDKPACTKKEEGPTHQCYRPLKEGIADEKWRLKDDYMDYARQLLEELNATFPTE